MNTIYAAARVLTMDAAQPHATHVAVHGDRIAGVGDLDAMKALGPHAVDERFADQVLMPGFVEAHCHLTEGTYWRYPYVGYFDRADPHGRVWSGCRSVASVLDRLGEFDREQPGTSPLSAWGLDAIHYADRPPSRAGVSRCAEVSACRHQVSTPSR